MITDLELAGRSVLVCGGGAEALPVITELLAAGALVTVIGTRLTTTVLDLPGRSGLTVAQRDVEDDDLDQAALVIFASGSAVDDEALAVRARARNRAVIMVSRPTEPQPDRDDHRAGRVILVGGGPGPVGLLTLAGQQAIREADVIITDRLAPLGALSEARPGTQIIDVAKIPRGEFTPQHVINDLLVEHATAGRLVVRLKGGDPFVFGRGGEEWQACAAAGLAVEVIPGVSSSVAAPALAGIPLTHRQLTQGFTVVSAHVPPGHPSSTLDWAALARSRTTLVIMMGVASLPAVTAELIAHGLAPETPAMSVADAGLPDQRSVRATLADLAERSAAAGITAPAISVIGAVAGFVA